MLTTRTEEQSDSFMDVKQCCADFYKNDFVRILFGDSLHPGALKLTEELGHKIGLEKDDMVLDVACGVGTSSIFFAKKFGCKTTGIDLSQKNIETAITISSEQGTQMLTKFKVGDAEKFDFENDLFDAVICECSLCLFPDKTAAVKEMFKVLKKNGKIGISDVVVRGKLPKEMQDALYKFICILDAKSEPEYNEFLEEAGFSNITFQDKKVDMLALLDDIKRRIFAAELAIGLGKLKLDVDINMIKQVLHLVRNCVDSGLVSYTLITAEK